MYKFAVVDDSKCNYVRIKDLYTAINMNLTIHRRCIRCDVIYRWTTVEKKMYTPKIKKCASISLF